MRSERSLTSPDYLLNVDIPTASRIAALGGVVGIIFSDHWLRPRDSTENGIELVVRAIQFLIDKVGLEVVAIGSDLDGFINPVEGLNDLSRFSDLRLRLLQQYDHSPVSAILQGNALRALRLGWGVATFSTKTIGILSKLTTNPRTAPRPDLGEIHSAVFP